MKTPKKPTLARVTTSKTKEKHHEGHEFVLGKRMNLKLLLKIKKGKKRILLNLKY